MRGYLAAMSQENVEILRRGFEAFNRRDKAQFDEGIAPDAELHPVPEWPENSVIHGRDAIWEFFVANEAVWEPGDYEVIETIDAGESVFAHVRHRVTGKGSGVPVEFHFYGAFAIRNGQASRIDYFLNRDQALAAAGLPL